MRSLHGADPGGPSEAGHSVVQPARRAGLERLYFQMLGARDQVAEAVRRLPLETGDLYDEDKERYEEAVAAFERVCSSWEKAGG